MHKHFSLRRVPGSPPEGGGGRPDPGSAGGGDAPGPAAHEPAFRAPLPALLVAASLPLLFGLQALSGEGQALVDRFGFRPSALAQGGWTGLLTAPWTHAGWAHAALNAVAALAFGAPVARRLGQGARGAAAFFVFYVVCGVVGSLGFAPFHMKDGSVLVGASGAIAGLMGASSRLVPPHAQGPLAPFTSRTVLAMAGGWVVVNLAFGILGMNVGAGDAPLAWEAHLAGYAAGLVLIGPAVRLLDDARAAPVAPGSKGD